MKSYPALLILRDASVTYRTESGERLVWSRVSMDIRAGEWIAVAGTNGSGKSTLAAVLLGIRPLSHGSFVRPDDCVVRGVLQSPDSQFVGETIEDELENAIGAEGLTQFAFDRLCADALAAVGLALPPKRSLAGLSGGQKQLVNLAAALSSRPDVLVLDEPTAMLDPDARLRVLAAVREAHRRGTAVVWITHRLEEACHADRVIAFAKGAIAFDGAPRSFFYGRRDRPEAQTGAPGAIPCLALDMALPYVVRIAAGLIERGHDMEPLPLHADELAEAVGARCR